MGAVHKEEREPLKEARESFSSFSLSHHGNHIECSVLPAKASGDEKVG